MDFTFHLYQIRTLLKQDFNKIELQLELDIANVEFYVYFCT